MRETETFALTVGALMVHNVRQDLEQPDYLEKVASFRAAAGKPALPAGLIGFGIGSALVGLPALTAAGVEAGTDRQLLTNKSLTAEQVEARRRSRAVRTGLTIAAGGGIGAAAPSVVTRGLRHAGEELTKALHPALDKAEGTGKRLVDAWKESNKDFLKGQVDYAAERVSAELTAGSGKLPALAAQVGNQLGESVGEALAKKSTPAAREAAGTMLEMMQRAFREMIDGSRAPLGDIAQEVGERAKAGFGDINVHHAHTHSTNFWGGGKKA